MKFEYTRAQEACNSGELAQYRLSDNVGGVKQLLSDLSHALVEERYFALVEMARTYSTASLVIFFQVQNFRSDPCISSVSHCDHDYYFELLREEERDAQSISRCSTAHHRDVRAVPRANRTFSAARSPISFASSNTTHR